jgi:hypothetical protein
MSNMVKRAVAFFILFLASIAPAYCQCGTTIPGGTICGNRSGAQDLNQPITNPLLGIPGSKLGSISFANLNAGTVKLQPVSGALGTQTINIPAASGTMAVSASSPVTLSAAGNVSLQGASNTVVVGSGGTGSLFTATPTLGTNGGTGGSITLNGATAGSAIFSVAATGGTAQINGPFQAGASTSGNTHSLTSLGGSTLVNIGTAGTSDGRLVIASPTANAMTVVSASSATGTATLPSGTYNIVGDSLSQGLTNKTITSSTNVLGGVTMTLGSDATGDIYYRNSGGVLTRLAIGSGSNVLTVSGGLPSWAASAVSSVSNSDGTLTISPTTGAVVASINLSHANVWTAAQTIQSNSSSALLVQNSGGVTTLQVDASAASLANGVAVIGSAAGSAVQINAIGGTNVSMSVQAKGSGSITLTNTSGNPFTLNVGVAGASNGSIVLASPTANAMTLVSASSATGTATFPSGTYTLAGLSLNQTFSGNDTFSGQAIHTGTSAPSSAAGNTVVMGTLSGPPTLTNTGQAFFYNTTAGGAVISGDGSSDDFRLYNKSGTLVANVVTGGTAITASITGHSSLDLALTGGTMSGAIAMGTNAITGLTTLAAAGAMTFQSNGSTLAGTITTGQKWGLNKETNPQYDFVVSDNVTTGITLSSTIAAFIAADAAASNFVVASFGTGVNPGFFGFVSRGTAASPTAVQANDVLSFFGAAGSYGGAGNYQQTQGLAVFANETFSSTNKGAYAQMLLTANGSSIARGVVWTSYGSGGFGIGASTSDPGAGGLYVSGATITLNALATDATHTDRTVCQDTTSKNLFFGSGAAGICLGTSSIQFKVPLGELSYGLADVMKLDPVKWHPKAGYGDESRIHYGFYAEDIAKVFPDLAGRDNTGRVINYDWPGLIPILVKSVQELKADNDNLRALLQKAK